MGGNEMFGVAARSHVHRSSDPTGHNVIAVISSGRFRFTVRSCVVTSSSEDFAVGLREIEAPRSS